MIDNSRFNELNNELNKVTEAIHDNQITVNQLKKSRDSLSRLENELSGLYEQLEKEEHDIEKLKSLSFVNFLHTLMNDKAEKLSKEEEEVLEIKSKIDYMNYEIEKEELHITRLNNRIIDTRELDNKYKVLIVEKKRLIQEKLPNIWDEIEARNKKIEGLNLNQKELQEAIDAGSITLNKVKDIQKSLQTAANWGTYDMLGGGALATLAKRNHMNNAQNQVNELQYTLKKFNAELYDVGKSLAIDLGIGDFLGFADWVFDGFFVDWAVQFKITNAKEQMDQLYTKINQLLVGLKDELSRTKSQVEVLIKENDEQIKGI